MDSSVFISFASKDRSVAMTICDALERRGIGCWISSRDIRAGENFQTAIVRAIRGAKVMLLVFSTNSNNSEEIKKELVLAGQSRLVVIPVRVEDVTPDEAFAYEFATRQWIDLFDDWDRELQNLATQIEAITRGYPQPASAGARRPTPSSADPSAIQTGSARNPAASGIDADAHPPRWRRYVLPATAGAAILCAGLATGFWFREGGQRAFVAEAPQQGPIADPRPVAPPAPSPAPTASSPRTPEDPTADALKKGNEAQRKKDYPEAIHWYREAANRGSAPAQAALGAFYEAGLGIEKDYIEAAHWYREAAGQSDPQGQAGLAWLYLKGWGLPKDYAEAMRLGRLAASQDDPRGQTVVGELYDNGWGVPQDVNEAMRWYRKAAEKGDPEAEASIGWLYAMGQGIGQDHVEATRRFRLAADRGNEIGQYGIGYLYLYGRGVTKDFVQAMRWFRLAADQGYAPAQASLGTMYASGWGVEVDFTEAMRWYRKAADQGYALAQSTIGDFYLNGAGVPRDLNQAREWWRKAAEGGDESAKKSLARYRGGAR